RSARRGGCRRAAGRAARCGRDGANQPAARAGSARHRCGRDAGRRCADAAQGHRPEHVRLLAELVTAREEALGMEVGHTRFLALIEGPAALPHLYAIAAEPRMVGMSVGGEDMATELGAIPSADSMYVFAMMGLAACRTAGILPMGSMGQLANINDLESYRAGLKRGAALGFTTASCIHPAHVPIINEEYGASAGELDRARRLIAAFDAAAGAGAGAVAFEGSMIDLPVVVRARRLLERAESWARSGNP